MAEINRMLFKSLTKIRNQINNLNIEDHETIIQIGAGFEEILAQMPEDYTEISSLLELCLIGLQALYEKTSQDLPALSQAIASATVALEQVVFSPSNPVCQHMLNKARDLLTNLLNPSDNQTTDSDNQDIADDNSELSTTNDTHDTAESSSIDNSSENLSITNDHINKPSLEKILEIFSRLNLNDSTSLIKFRATLMNFIDNGEQETEVPCIKEVLATVDKIITGQAKNLKGQLKKIGELLQSLINPAIEKPAFLEAPKNQLIKIESAIERTSDNGSSNNDEKRVINLPTDRDDKLLAEFIAESQEYIDSAEAALLLLENDPNNLEAINTVFRAFHTIKGTSALLGISTLAKLAHQSESLLSQIRDHEISFSEQYADLAFASTDMIKVLLERLKKALMGEKILRPTKYTRLIEVLSDLKKFDQGTALNEKITYSDTKITYGKEHFNSMSSSADNLLNTQNSANKSTSEESFIRVKTDKLDGLIDLIGELVISHSMLSQDESVICSEESNLVKKIADSGKIVRELQDLSMTIRMVPLKTSFQKLTRLVRDLAPKSGKVIDFLISGEETEIDRHMVNFITDPLIHMVRNSIDHGIESPNERESKEKPRTGKIQLRAYHASGNVAVELQDDGRGLDAKKILQKAIDKGLIKSGEGLSEADIFKLIFVPGFSTADQLTDISGRGVGMDVVKRNIEALHGTIEISSELNKGTIFSLNLPLTLAITDGMLVRIGTERYILPTLSIYLSFCPKATMLSTVVGQGEMVMLRGELMPIFRLHRLFDIPGAIEDLTKALLIVVADGKRRCALLVDELLGQQQVVTKSLGSNIRKPPGISGGTILGDGCVGLMLDVSEIIALAKTQPNKGFARNNVDINCINLSVERDNSMITEKVERPDDSLGGKYLTFFLSNEEYGIEILKVHEIIGLMAITRIPQTPHFIKGVINLRGKVITVIDLRLKFNLPEQKPTPETCIIVVQTGGIEMGIIVDKVSEVLAINDKEIENIPSFGLSINADFLLGVSKAQENVRLLLDIDQVLSPKELRAISNLASEHNLKNSNEIGTNAYLTI